MVSMQERYETNSLIQDDMVASLFRGQLSPGNRPALIKELKQVALNPKSVARLRHDFQILREHPTAASLEAYALIEQDGNFALCLEDVEGIFLSDLTAKGPMPIKEFLPLAQAIVAALAHLQSAHIIHKNLNPSDILWNKEKNLVKILDFSIATTLAKETPTDVAGSVLEGTLAYMSPEQTGRMNISLDYRSDFYALGVIFYQLLTGRLPFEQTDMLALVHAHLALMPEAPHLLNPDIPLLLSAIVLKLLDKRPDKRYQTAIGLLNDLEKAVIVLKDNSATFELGQQDLNPSLQISSKLYGREESVKTLQEDYASVLAGKKCITLVAGAPGIGKTSLVNELYKPITERAGFFIRGKYDQLQSGTPYSALSQAFASVIRQILLAPEEEVQAWKTQLNEALAPNGQVMVNIIPALELLIGKQPAPPSINITQEETRLNNVIEQFIRALATEAHPLALFLDDLQWIDPASLKIFQRLFSSDASRWLYFVGAYRDTEVSETHPLMHALTILQKAGVETHQLKLGPLSEAASAAWLADTLASKPEDVKSLAELCYRKTAGNPFFLKQFVQALYEDRLLKLDLKQRTWVWDIQQVERKQMTDNVIELMSSKINSLPANQIELLKLAACIGNHFSLEILKNITNQSLEDLSVTLWELFRSELILPENEEYKYLKQTEAQNVKCYFLHDRVQEAAYSLMDQKDREKTHLSIGRLLLKHMSESERDTHLFDILSHLDRGRNFITDPGEKENLVKLNLQATQKAIQATAFNVAKNLITVGLELLGESPWESDYQSTLIFYQFLTLSHLCLNEHDKVHEIAEMGIQHAKNGLDRAEFYNMRIGSYSITGQFNDAVALTRQSLDELGLNMPKNPRFYHAILNYLKMKWSLRGKKIADLIKAPPMQDPIIKARVRVLTGAHLAMAFGAKSYFAWEVSMRTLYLIQYGMSEEAPAIYADAGYLLDSEELDIQWAYEFGNLACEVIKSQPNNQYNIFGQFIYNSYVAPLSSSAHEIYDNQMAVYQLSKRNTDPVWGLIAYSNGSFDAPWTQSKKQNLNSLLEELRKHEQEVKDSGAPLINLFFSEPLRMAKIFSGETPVPARLVDDAVVSAEIVDILQPFYLCSSAALAYSCDAYDQAGAALERPKGENDFLPKSYALIVILYVYTSLIKLALYPKADFWKKREYVKFVKANQARLKKRMSLYKQNHEHYYLLVEAELCRVLGKDEKAQLYYSEAIKAADKNDFAWALALCYELAAKYYAGKGLLEIAKFHMQEALMVYSNWGALGKVRHLEALYPNLCSSQKSALASNTAAVTTMTATSSEAFDLSTVMRANQTISGEIQLDKLMEKMLLVIIENAGAEAAVFIEKRNDLWLPLAKVKEASRESKFEFYSGNSVPCEFPEQVITFCVRAEEPVVLANASESSEFQNDPYIKRYQVKSLLCMPIVHQKNLLGLIYLENNLTVGSFTQDRLSILRSLSTQIAISLENARHFDEMESLYRSTERFVPKQFLEILHRKNIREIELGDCLSLKISVLFADIRKFTTILEKLDPESAFAFVNRYWALTAPIIRKNNGFINQYQGDGILALFVGTADDAVAAGKMMFSALVEFNKEQEALNAPLLEIGVGINSGPAMIGIIGEKERLEPAVVSDVANTASRIETLNKSYGTHFLISGSTFNALKNHEINLTRAIDKVLPKGKSETTYLHEVIDWESQLKNITLAEYLALFAEAFSDYEKGEFRSALKKFSHCLSFREKDRVVETLCQRCEEFIETGAPENWNGVYTLTHK